MWIQWPSQGPGLRIFILSKFPGDARAGVGVTPGVPRV